MTYLIGMLRETCPLQARLDPGALTLSGMGLSLSWSCLLLSWLRSQAEHFHMEANVGLAALGLALMVVGADVSLSINYTTPNRI